MKKLAQKIITMGADFSTKKALKTTLNFLGIKPENIDKLYIELKNSFYRDVFKRIPPKDKILFLPQCLRKQNCKAVLTKKGFVCNGCEYKDKCKIYKIINKAEKLGYKTFIVPGGSMVMNIIEELKPKAVAGVACLKELVLAAENITNIPIQGIELTKDGCVNTDVDLKQVFNIL